MYLKKIEAQGFKSFANKMVLEFNPGIMGIVGPNGSGKSNVADAVRWVLGEQSAKSLRGNNMQDVIFAGTENRKPQGYAYVGLTIDNSDHMLAIDFDEVTISRRVYRSGESEYLINGGACRLKDIYELFYDTGVGKEGYSIIGQGQIDRILSGKPEERRELFDEAAGIVKFKKRRQVAAKKLESEETNLVRVSDILGELEKQVGPLEKQAEKAREYLKLKEELKSCEIGAFFLESDDLRRRIRVVDGNLSVVNDDLAKSRQDAENLRLRYEAITASNEQLVADMEENRKALEQTRLKKESLEGRIRVLEEQIRTARMNEEHIRARLADIGREEKDCREGQEAFIADKKKLNAELDQAEAVIAEKSQEFADIEETIRRSEELIAAKSQEIIAGLNEKAEISVARQKFQTQLEQAQITRSEIHRYLLSAKTDEEEQQNETDRLSNELAAVREAMAKETKAQEQALAAGSEAEKQVNLARRRLNDCQQEYHTTKTKLESLVNMTERYEGYGSSIRRVMERKKDTPGIVGVVADLIHVEKKYETAMETALGGRIQNIVTKDEATAKGLIEYLKKNKFGRATFLPITNVNGSPFPKPEALKEPGALGVASELVTVDEAYRGIARYLLGRTLVADTIDHALAIARKYRQTLNIVTLEGESLTPGGAMTGGAFRSTTNLLGRRREIEELEKAMKTALKKYDEIKDFLHSEEQKFAEARKQVDELQRHLHDDSLRERTISMNLSRAEDELAAIRENCTAQNDKNRSIQAKIEQIEAEASRMAAAAEETEARGEAIQMEIDQLRAQNEQTKQTRDQISGALAEQRLAYAGLQQRDTYLAENIQRLKRELEKYATEKETLTGSRADGEEAVKEKQSAIAAARNEIEEAIREAKEKEETLAGQTKTREDGQAEQKKFFVERESLSSRITALDKDSYRLQSQKERMEESLDKQVEYLWTEYEITPSEAEAQRNEAYTDLTEVRRTISRHKTAIRELGPVNVNAIEDYKEVSERYVFMRDQHADLVEARDSLMKIIADLDEGMRRQFEEKFEAIRVEFDRVFRELFGGGKGELALTHEDGTDILEAGIAIIAQPPGKKLQNMMQLSGGEKALSAIALLFAIQNLKPSPFCLLDEIEAALDEPNVARYAEYLNKLKEHTQFIVITHRRGTMEMADRLYGITMQEKGVSALVSVDLTDTSLTGEAG